MVFVRDIWVNWFEGEENGYNVCEFYEWRSIDRIEVLDQAVIARVTPELFDYIENQIAPLPEQLLKAVYQKSYLRKNMSRIQLDYCFIATDGKKVLAVDTIGYETPIRKSRLTPRQEKLVFEAMENKEMDLFDLHIPMEKKEYHILSPHPEEMLGLTRKERQLKQLLFIALDQLFSTKNVAEIRYWCTEWDPSKYELIQKLTLEETIEFLLKEVRIGWSQSHYDFCESLVKGQPFFEKLWELEHGESVK